jgi:hypothetical protein
MMTEQPGRPTEAFFWDMLDDLGLTLSEERVAASLATYRAARPDLERLRAIPQSFLEPVFEPASALRWLEAGGVSQ